MNQPIRCRLTQFRWCIHPLFENYFPFSVKSLKQRMRIKQQQQRKPYLITPLRAWKTMSISVKCQCGMTFQAKPELAGKRVKCGSCKAPILIPQSGQSTGPPPSSTSEVFVACQCGQQFKVATQYAGQQVNCPKCQVSLPVPGGA